MFQLMNPMAKSTAMLEIFILMAVAALLGYLLCKNFCQCATKRSRFPSSNGRRDDLKKIEGIGPVIEEFLKAKGLTSFAQLAAMSGDEINAVLRNAGTKFQTSDAATWPEQAALACDGRWQEFEALKKSLLGGRRK